MVSSYLEKPLRTLGQARLDRSPDDAVERRIEHRDSPSRMSSPFPAESPRPAPRDPSSDDRGGPTVEN